MHVNREQASRNELYGRAAPDLPTVAIRHRLLDKWLEDESGYDEETWP